MDEAPKSPTSAPPSAFHAVPSPLPFGLGSSRAPPPSAISADRLAESTEIVRDSFKEFTAAIRVMQAAVQAVEDSVDGLREETHTEFRSLRRLIEVTNNETGALGTQLTEQANHIRKLEVRGNQLTGLLASTKAKLRKSEAEKQSLQASLQDAQRGKLISGRSSARALPAAVDRKVAASSSSSDDDKEDEIDDDDSDSDFSESEEEQDDRIMKRKRTAHAAHAAAFPRRHFKDAGGGNGGGGGGGGGANASSSQSTKLTEPFDYEAHKARLAKLSSKSALINKRDECELCDIHFKDEMEAASHYYGQLHRANIKLRDVITKKHSKETLASIPAKAAAVASWKPIPNPEDISSSSSEDEDESEDGK